MILQKVIRCQTNSILPVKTEIKYLHEVIKSNRVGNDKVTENGIFLRIGQC